MLMFCIVLAFFIVMSDSEKRERNKRYEEMLNTPFDNMEKPDWWLEKYGYHYNSKGELINNVTGNTCDYEFIKKRDGMTGIYEYGLVKGSRYSSEYEKVNK